MSIWTSHLSTEVQESIKTLVKLKEYYMDRQSNFQQEDVLILFPCYFFLIIKGWNW